MGLCAAGVSCSVFFVESFHQQMHVLVARVAVPRLKEDQGETTSKAYTIL